MTITEAMVKEGTRLPLPPGWRWVRLGDITQIATGGTPSTSHSEYYGGEIHWLTSGDVKGTRIYDVPNRITQLGLNNSNAKVHPSGSVMLAMSGQGKTRGTSAILMVPSSCSQSVAAILPTTEALPEIIHFSLVGLYGNIRRITGDNERTGLNLKLIQKIEIPLPPLVEQARIARILDEQMVSVEKARAAAKVRLEAAKALPAAYLRTVFESEETKEWQHRRLGDVLRVKSGSFLPANSMNTSGKYPVYGGNGINGYHDSFMFEEPKIIIGRVGAQCGCICVSEPYSWITDNALYVSEKLIPFENEFMALLLTQLDLNGKANSMAQPLVTGKIIYDVEVPLPNTDKQKQIAIILTDRFDATENLSAGIEGELRTINALPTALLRQAFSGGL